MDRSIKQHLACFKRALLIILVGGIIVAPPEKTHASITPLTDSIALQDAIWACLQNHPLIQIETQRHQAIMSQSSTAITEFLPELTLQYRAEKERRRSLFQTVQNDAQFQTALTLRQNIFKGFQSLNKIDEVEHRILESEAAKNTQITKTILDAVQLYLQLYLIQEKEQLLTKKQQLAERIGAIIAQREKKGLASKLDLLSWELEHAELRNEISENKRERKTAELQFFQYFSMQATALKAPVEALWEFDKNKYKDSINRQNPRLQAQFARLQQKQSQLQQLYGSLLPQIDLEANWLSETNAVHANNRGIDTHSLGLVLSLPFLERGTTVQALSQLKNEIVYERKKWQYLREELLAEFQHLEIQKQDLETQKQQQLQQLENQKKRCHSLSRLTEQGHEDPIHSLREKFLLLDKQYLLLELKSKDALLFYKVSALTAQWPFT